jgi:hypothetical protein
VSRRSHSGRPHPTARRLSARAGVGLTAALLTLLSTATPAFAHGVQGQAETPVPLKAFFVAAAIVIVVSFVGLAFAWSTPRWATVGWRPAPAGLSRTVLHPVTVWTLRVLVLAGLALVLVAAAFGSELLNRNIAPVTVFVFWWIGLVPLALLLGNVWREINPWAAIARLLRAPADTGRYPRTWGIWPAAALLVVWAWLELVYPTAAEPRLLAAVILMYSVVTVGAMFYYGVDTWLDQGETFSVYTRLLATMSPIEVRELDGQRRLGFRPAFIGATQIPALPGLVAYVVVLIGIVSFDGLSGTEVWKERDVAATERLIDLGLPGFEGGIVVATIGLLLTLGLVALLFEAAAAAANRSGHLSEGRVSRVTQLFAHSLVPIALGYAVAHSLTLWVFQSQDLIRLASDPLGQGRDFFGTADYRIDFTVMSPNFIWAVQLIAVVGAHVLGLVLAHDRALQLSSHAKHAVRSQYPFLVLMVILTVTALWLLSQGMTPADA